MNESSIFCIQGQGQDLLTSYLYNRIAIKPFLFFFKNMFVNINQHFLMLLVLLQKVFYFISLYWKKGEQIIVRRPKTHLISHWSFPNIYTTLCPLTTSSCTLKRLPFSHALYPKTEEPSLPLLKKKFHFLSL